MATKSKVSFSGRQNGAGTYIDLAFSNGTTRTFLLTADHPLFNNFAAHGFGKKVRDQISTAASVEEAVEQVDALFAAFKEGKWNVLRNSEGMPTVGVLAKALSRLYNKSLDDAQAFVSKLSKKQQADLRKEASVALEIAKLNAEAPETAGVADLLAAFGGNEDSAEAAQ